MRSTFAFFIWRKNAQIIVCKAPVVAAAISETVTEAKGGNFEENIRAATKPPA